MEKKKRTIVCLSLSEMDVILNNKNLSDYLFNFKSNNKISSAPETIFIAYVMSYFKPLRFKNISGTNVVINGVHGCYSVNFHLQKKAYNPKTKKSLSNDLIIELYDSDTNEIIAKIGLEYDGHPEHTNSWGIVSDKEKDLIVLKQTGMMRLRIAPEFFQSTEDRKDVYRAVKKYFEQYIKLIPKKKRNVNPVRTYIECPLCEGVQVLGAQSCPVCMGNGYVLNNIYSKIDIDVFDSFDCPDCTKMTIRNCRKCRGKGFLNRDEAIRIRKEELNTL
ncbi:hypothetical protein [Citrobacter freundii]|uniref:hypothetical protein n=1 Tax=Citrobacter freundii TaxID=546 RepID=UPI00388EEDC3